MSATAIKLFDDKNRQRGITSRLLIGKNTKKLRIEEPSRIFFKRKKGIASEFFLLRIDTIAKKWQKDGTKLRSEPGGMSFRKWDETPGVNFLAKIRKKKRGKQQENF